MSANEFTCIACGGSFTDNPKVARALAGSKGDPETPHLCWICTRLHHSVMTEAKLALPWPFEE